MEKHDTLYKVSRAKWHLIYATLHLGAHSQPSCLRPCVTLFFAFVILIPVMHLLTLKIKNIFKTQKVHPDVSSFIYSIIIKASFWKAQYCLE